MNAQEIRNAYLKFYEDRGHKIVSRAPLVLTGDPTTLFTGSGMQPMIPYLLGEKHPAGTRLTDSQTCIRAQDIDDVGDNRHTTFFEMLGNWSFGDYYKAEAIEWVSGTILHELSNSGYAYSQRKEEINNALKITEKEKAIVMRKKVSLQKVTCILCTLK